MGDKAAAVDRITCSGPERHLEGCQWADHPEPCLSNHDADSHQVAQAKPWVLDPGPTPRASDQYENEAEDHANHERQVNGEYQVSSYSVEHSTHP